MCKVQKRNIGGEGESAQRVWRIHKDVQGKEAETMKAWKPGREQWDNEDEVGGEGRLAWQHRWDRVGGRRVWNGGRFRLGLRFQCQGAEVGGMVGLEKKNSARPVWLSG